MTSIFKRFLGAAFLVFGLLALLCTMPVSPARAGFADETPGDPCHPPGAQSCSDPIILPYRNVYEKVTDFTTVGQNPLAVTRHFNSEVANPIKSFGSWSWTYDGSLAIGPSLVEAARPDGKVIDFRPDLKGGWLNASSDLDLKLTQTGATTWTLTDWDDNVETYTTIKGVPGTLTSIKARGDYTQTMHYSANLGHNGLPLLMSVTDSYGRTLTITYDNTGICAFSTCIGSIAAPDGLVLTYSYNKFGDLKKVSYSTTPATSLTYLYDTTDFASQPLTGIIDENGNRFATWTYLNTGDGPPLPLSSQHAGGADLTTVAYHNLFNKGNATVTYPLGLQEVYKVTFFGTTANNKISEIDRVAPAAARTFTYDVDGYIASQTDWNGNLTTSVNEGGEGGRGVPKVITEAAGTSLARTTSISWLSNFHLPAQITEPNRTTAFTYDANGNLLTKTITAGALTRSFAYTYNATGEVLTATDPRGNVTHYAYDAKGNLTSVTDALGHVTSFTSYDGAGRPLTIIDPNGVTTSLTYDPRGRLTSQKVATLKTDYAYDKAGNLIKVTLPDDSTLTYTYDQAHRLTGITDALGDHIAYTLDAAGNHIKEQAFDPANTLTQTRSFAYNTLDRLKKTIGAESQTTVYDYDKQGNLTAVTDPLNHAATYAYDALNRLAEAIDPKGGTTFYGYNVHDDLKSVLDPRDLKTAYAWDGLEDQLQLTSPDTGVTSNTYDAAGNVITSTDARGETTTYSYDALNRRTHAAFAEAL